MTDENQTTEISTEVSNKKKFNPKLLGIVVVVLLLAGLAYYFKNLFIAATVDGHLINRLAIIKKLEKQSGKTILDSMIDDQLLNNAASKANITVSDDEMNKKLDEIKAQIETSGGTFDAALTTANLTLEDLKKQITLQLKLEKLLGDKLTVSDEELNKYITDNKIPLATGQEEQTKNQVRDQIKSDKFNAQVSTFLADLRTKAKIRTFVNY